LNNHSSGLTDITIREDIEYVMRSFYEKAIQHPDIGSFFTEIAQIDLESHLPHICDFWEQQLLYSGNYKKNVLQIHQELYNKKLMKQIHFNTWLTLFNTTIDTHFQGPQADLMKTRALSIATVMQLKIK